MDFETRFIENDESKIIFEEILVNFYHNNFRSCIVSLNSLLYFDLVTKLKYLYNNYDYKKAKVIIEDINKMINDDDKYSEVERKILFLCKEKNIIDNYFLEKAENLRKIRNHCAHPAFCADKIYIPSKCEVAMYIDFLYKDLLSKSSINYYDVVNFVLEDISNAFENKIDYNSNGLKERAKRLYAKIDEKNIQELFNSLFELCIIKNTEECKQNRDYTYVYLKLLVYYVKNKNININYNVLKKINISHLDKDYFNGNQYMAQIIIDNIISINLIKENNSEIFELYKEFLCENQYLYKIYDELFDSTDDFIEYLISDKTDFLKISRVINNLEIVKDKKYFYKILKKLIELTPKTNGFDKSDYCIKLYTNNYDALSEKNADELLILMNSNDQFFTPLKVKNKEKNEKELEKVLKMSVKEKIEEIDLNAALEDFEPSFLDDWR